MCYNAAYLTKKKIEYARRHGASEEDISELEQELRRFEEKYFSYNTSGFAFPHIPVVTDENPKQFQLLTWGMVPYFMKYIKHPKDLSWNTLNCVGEKMFETKSFQVPASQRRCLIYFDGFFEPHHYKGVSYPFYIKHHNDEPLIIAGLWDQNEHIKSVSLVTVEASPLLKKVHNEKKRMPLIIPHELRFEWLKPINDNADKEAILDLIKPYDDDLLETFTVPPIRSNKKLNFVSPGNEPEAIEEYRYPSMPEDYYQDIISKN